MRRLFALASVGAALVAPVAQAADPLPIGFIGTLSGIGAPVGRDALDGFRLVLESTADHLGGIEVQVVLADDQGQPEVAAKRAEALRGDGTSLFILASALPAANLAAASVTTAARDFTLGLSRSPEMLAGKGCNPFFFSLAPTADAEQAVMARYLAEVGRGRIWLASAQTDSARAEAQAFKTAFTGSVAGESVARRGQMNFPDTLAKIEKAEELDGVYSVINGGMGVNFVRQIEARGLKKRLALFAPGSFLDQPYTAAMGDAGVAARAAAPWVEDLDNPVNARFATEFEAHYGRPPSASAAFGYDAALLLDSAFRNAAADATTKDKVEAMRNALRRAEFQSVRGGFRFQTNHFPLQNWYLVQVVRTARGRIGNETRQVLVKDARDSHASECPMHWQDPLAPPVRPTKGGAGR